MEQTKLELVAFATLKKPRSSFEKEVDIIERILQLKLIVTSLREE